MKKKIFMLGIFLGILGACTLKNDEMEALPTQKTEIITVTEDISPTEAAKSEDISSELPLEPEKETPSALLQVEKTVYDDLGYLIDETTEKEELLSEEITFFAMIVSDIFPATIDEVAGKYQYAILSRYTEKYFLLHVTDVETTYNIGDIVEVTGRTRSFIASPKNLEKDTKELEINVISMRKKDELKSMVPDNQKTWYVEKFEQAGYITFKQAVLVYVESSNQNYLALSYSYENKLSMDQNPPIDNFILQQDQRALINQRENPIKKTGFLEKNVKIPGGETADYVEFYGTENNDFSAEHVEIQYYDDAFNLVYAYQIPVIWAHDLP